MSEKIAEAQSVGAARPQTEDDFRRMADAIPQIVWVTDGKGKTEYFNRQWFEYTGSTVDPLSAEQVSDDFIHPDDVEATLAAFSKALATRRTYTVEHRIRSADGDYRWFLVRGEPQVDPRTGEVIRVFGSSTDIHDRKLSEAALRESEERLRFLAKLESKLFAGSTAVEAMCAATSMLGRALQASRCAYADVDADTDRFWIRNDFNAPGIESSAGTYSLDLFGPRAAADMRAGRTLIVNHVAAELAPGEGRETFESIGIQAIVCCPLIKAGSLRAMMAVHQVEPRLWSTAEIALIRDVVERCWSHVERVGAEARLRESEERLRLAVDNADVGFWDVDMIADKLIWPPRTKGMFGISPDVPVTMKDFYDGLHPDDRATTSAAFEAAADPDRRELYDVEYRTVGKEDGVVRWVAAKGRGVFREDGRCVRVTGTAVEITARKRAEEALNELNATLEARIKQAIEEREEAHAALRQSQKMEAMGQLTGGVAHDFNNLLTPIVGALDMLQRQGFGGEREQRLVAGAMQSSERAKTLVQRLLAFARRQPLQRVSVNVAQLVQTMGGLIESTTGPHIHVVVDADETLRPARADPNQLEMALLNLAVNARDAMPTGGTLRITAREEEVTPGMALGLAAGSYVRLSVADTGEGMDEHTLARAIEPFFSTKGIGKGTGLGLSMVHGLSKQLGGTLKIDSRPGVGTTVELWLPVGDDEPVAEAAAKAIDPHPVPRAGRVLLVDDEDLARLSTADMLAGMGFDVVEAQSGEEALKILDGDEGFDLIVTDHLMPGLSGMSVARTVRSTNPSMPILLISGYAENQGVDADIPRLTKPFRRSELETIVAQVVATAA